VLDDTGAMRLQVTRQVAHWRAAVIALDDFENFAAPSSWANLERYLNVAMRSQLRSSVDRLLRYAEVLAAELRAAESLEDFERVRRLVVRFRRRFLQVETALDFYGDAVNTRTNAKLGGLLRACDILAAKAMEQVLKPLGRPTPPCLTYVEKGLGASILRSGLRLWDGRSLSTAAAIKVTRHNLGRPTAILHEAGHQVAFTLNWNNELANAFRGELADAPDVGDAFAGWAQEIAGDVIGFCTAGYAAVAALHDVIAGEEQRVWSVPLGDPHPPAYLRVLLNVAMAQSVFGYGPWMELARAWTIAHPISRAPSEVRALHARSVERLPRIAEVCLGRPMRAFGGRPIVALVDPRHVRPDALLRLERDAGTALYSSPHWLWNESLQLLALSGYRAATQPERATEIAQQFEDWMLRLGQGLELAAA
jgi:hypothetical protein